MAFYCGAVVLFHTGKPEKAREYVDRLLKANANSPDGLVIKGWIEMSAGKEGKVKDILHYFSQAWNTVLPRGILMLYLEKFVFWSFRKTMKLQLVFQTNWL